MTKENETLGKVFTDLGKVLADIHTIEPRTPQEQAMLRILRLSVDLCQDLADAMRIPFSSDESEGEK